MNPNTTPSVSVTNLAALLNQMEGLQITINITGRIALGGHDSGKESSAIEQDQPFVQVLQKLESQIGQTAPETGIPNHTKPTAASSVEWTSRPAEAGNTSQVLPEFGRWQDVQRLFGIKRSKLYFLMQQGVVKSISLRRKGQKHSCRLIYLPGRRAYLESLLKEQNAG